MVVKGAHIRTTLRVSRSSMRAIAPRQVVAADAYGEDSELDDMTANKQQEFPVYLGSMTQEALQRQTFEIREMCLSLIQRTSFLDQTRRRGVKKLAAWARRKMHVEHSHTLLELA